VGGVFLVDGALITREGGLLLTLRRDSLSSWESYLDSEILESGITGKCAM
jgi:hypothetical protein